MKNTTTQQTHCFKCRQFEIRHISKLQACLTMLSLSWRIMAT